MIVANNELTNLRIVMMRAQQLEAFLGENCGTTADWPVKLIADNDETAEQLKTMLQNLQDAIKAASVA